MEGINEEKEGLKRLIESLNKENYKILTLKELPDYELRGIINQLDEIIVLAEKNKDFVGIGKLRQFYLDRANSYLYLNDYSSALKNFEKAKSLIEQEEADFDFHLLKCLEGISWCKARMGHYAESLIDCNELIACAFLKKALLSKFFTVRATCYRELGNTIFAERNFEIANVNQIFLDRIITEEGDESLESGLTAMGYNSLGNRYFEHNLLNEALLNYEKAIKLNPSYAKAYFNKGVILGENKNHNAAIEAYSKSISLDSTYSDAYLNRGNEYCYVFDFKSAIKDYNVCLMQEPDNELAKENREYAISLLQQY